MKLRRLFCYGARVAKSPSLSKPASPLARAALCLGLGLGPSAALAQPRRPPTRPTQAAGDQSLQAARQAYSEGTEHFNMGRYAEALESFQRAYALRANPVVQRPLAECHERLDHIAEAIAGFEAYLAGVPNAPDRAAVEARLTALRQRPGRVAVSSTPPGALIVVDGNATTDRTPAEVSVAPGTHRITLRAESFDATEQTVEVSPGARAEVTVALAARSPEPAPTQIAEPTPTPTTTPAALEPTDRPRRGPSPAVWVAAGVAGAGLIAGTVFGVMALSDANDYELNPTRDTYDRGRTNALISDIGFGAAILGATVAVVVYFAGRGRAERPAAAQAVRIGPGSLTVRF